MISNNDKISAAINKAEPFIPFSGPYTVFDQIISSYKDSDLLGLDQAYVYFYLYKFKKQGNVIMRSVKAKFQHVEEAININQSLDLAAEYAIYSFIISEYNNEFEILDKARSYFSKNRYYLNVYGHSGRILPKHLGFVLGLLTTSTSDDIYNTVIGNVNHDLINEQIFILNYYIGLKINQIKFDYNDAQRRGTMLINSNMVSALEKIPALIFVEKPELYFNEVIKAFTNPDFYYNLFNIHLEWNSSDFSSFQPISIVNFLMVSNMLGWDKLELVEPKLLENAKKLKDKKDPVILEKEYLKRKNVKVVLISIVMGAVIALSVILNISNSPLYEKLAGIVVLIVGLIFWLVDKKALIINPDKED